MSETRNGADNGWPADGATVPGLQVDVLGPLRLRVDGQQVEVPGQRRRALLALLALAGGRVLSVDGLIDALWPEDPPDTGSQALHSQISRLRRTLGAAAPCLRRHGSGYELQLHADGLDATVARRLAESTGQHLGSDPRRAADLAATALALWRGHALEEFPEVAPLAAEAVGLAELRSQLRDDATEARLLCGDRAVTADAAAAAGADPLRERTASLLMRALAAEGRAAEAMAAAATYRRRLADETGLDPGPGLSALEHEIAAGTLAPAPARVPPPAVSPAPPQRTVARPTGPLVGREQDRAELHRLVGSYPVVTVTGPGGVGKTRLTLDVAADLADHEGTEVVVVTLATVTDPDRVSDAVASTLGLRLSGDTSPVALAEALAGRRLLLVLDNCEHVVAACRELVSAVGSRAPGVRVLATSRVTLHVAGEYVVRLQPLPLPWETTEVSVLARQPSVRAFVEHAQRRHRGFTLTADDIDPVVDVIRRLDGLPLAIELAAGQLAVLPVRALRDRLGRVLDVLSAERLADESRQRTLRSTIGWSYDLLAPEERALLRALAPFPGGADLPTLEMLASHTVHDTDPLVVLSRLVDASLVVTEPTMSRYSLLETVRSFMLDDLDRRGERADAERRFLDWARHTALELGAALGSAAEPDADRRLRAELANLRAARDLARALGDHDVRVDITLALDEASIWRDLHELWSWSLELAADPALHGHPLEAAVLGSGAEAAWLQGELDLAERLVRQGFDAAAGASDGALTARCWGAMAAVALFRADFEASRHHYERAAALYPHPAGMLAGAALAAVYAGDRAVLDQSLLRARSAVTDQTSWSYRAFFHYVEGEAAAGHDTATAITEYAAAVDLSRRCGAGFIEGVAMVGLASIWAASGDVSGAARAYHFLLGYWHVTGSRTQLWTTARNAAWLLLERDRSRAAALLLAAADAAESAATVGSALAARTAQAYTALEQSLGATDLAQVRDEARTMPLSDLVQDTQRELDAMIEPA